MEYEVKSPKKLIEVAMPLDIINEACAYEKLPGIGAHPRGLHLWWSRKPLAATRAVLFAQLVNDPGFQQGNGFKYGVNKKEAAIERKRLFSIIEDLVKWENYNNEDVIERARVEIRRSWKEVCDINRGHPDAESLFNANQFPEFHDPFAGGGAIPLEAQRLGLSSFATDINPVSIMINKAMIEIPPRFCYSQQVFPKTISQQTYFEPSSIKTEPMFGLSEDIRNYGTLINENVKRKIGMFYPDVEIDTEMAYNRDDLQTLIGSKIPVVAWIWARTVKSPNPIYADVDVPLSASFVLSNKEDSGAYVEPIIIGHSYKFTVKIGSLSEDSPMGTKYKGNSSGFFCIMSKTPIDMKYIRQEAKCGRMGCRLMAIVADGARGKIYLPPTPEAESIAKLCQPTWAPGAEFFSQALGFRVGNYGISNWNQLFTSRQLLALTTFCEQIKETRELIKSDSIKVGFPDDNIALNKRGRGAQAYSEAVCVYLSFALDRCIDFSNSITRWVPGNQKVMNLFAKQTVSMTWGFPEAAILSHNVGGFSPAVSYVADCLKKIIPYRESYSFYSDAQIQDVSFRKIVSTDPPYYDNIGYADLSDFFYIWLRENIGDIYPDVFSTITVPKSNELVATPARHGGKENAELFFLCGMTNALKNLHNLTHQAFPITIYYAFKQAETKVDEGTSSTGWETFLSAIISAGFRIVGTWPLRSEQEYRMRNMGSNALASSIVLVCHRRILTAAIISRREFIRELNMTLPDALDEMTMGSSSDHPPVAPVDLAQAIIGPGMAIFTKYKAVLEANGTQMSVKTALQLINKYLADDDFDTDTQFCLQWYDQNGWKEDAFGVADVLARAKSTSVSGLAEAGVVESGNGIVRLKKWAEYPVDWNPQKDKRLPVWETLHQLIRALKQEGEEASGLLLGAVKQQTESVRQLAYRLYTLCERAGRSEDARVYNELITSWSGIEKVSEAVPTLEVAYEQLPMSRFKGE